MRWIGAAFSRLVQVALAWLLFLGLFCCCVPAPEDVSGLWRRIRTTLFFGTLVMVLVETRRARAAIRDLRGALGDPAPPPLSAAGCALACLVVGALLVGWGSWFAILSPNVHRIGSEDLVVALIAIAVLAGVWTFATVETVVLGWNGFTLLRLRLKAWQARAVERQRPSALPLTIGAWSVFAFFVALGFPSPELIGGMLWIGLAMLLIVAPEPEPLDLLVTVKSDRSIADVEALADAGVKPLRVFPNVDPLEDPILASTYWVRVPPEDALAVLFLASLDADSLWVDADSRLTPEPASLTGTCVPGLTRLPVDDPLSGAQSALFEVGGGEALTMLRGRRAAKPALVAVVDTGINGSHADLYGVTGAWPVPQDRDGHGTACAGVIAAVTDNGLGIASLNRSGAFVRVQSYAALANPRPDADDVARAIVDATADRADVINLSFVGDGPAPRVVAHAIRRAQERGAIVVAAAGNDGQDASAHWPANLPGVLVVGATQGGSPAPFSSSVRGVSRRVWAPGADVCSLGVDGGYERRTGTSMAAPMVSGLVGVMRALCPDVSADEAIAIVEASGAPVWGGDGTSVRADVALTALLQRHPDCDLRTRSFGGW